MPSISAHALCEVKCLLTNRHVLLLPVYTTITNTLAHHQLSLYHNHHTAKPNRAAHTVSRFNFSSFLLQLSPHLSVPPAKQSSRSDLLTNPFSFTLRPSIPLSCNLTGGGGIPSRSPLHHATTCRTKRMQ